MTAEIIVLVPSRGRPDKVAEFLKSWDDTTGEYATPMVVVDDDDPELSSYRDAVPQHRLTVGPRVRLGPTLNREAARWWGSYDVIGFMGDDHRPRTDDWDVQVAHEFDERRVNVAYGDDLFQRERLPTAVFVRAQLVSIMGYFCPPHQQHLYLDDYWLMLGVATGIRYLPDVVIEHLHPAAGKAAWDDQYREVNHPSVYEHDRVAFEAYTKNVWQDELARLRALGF